jgi:hypothetical protein
VKKVVLILFLLSALVGVNACGGGGSSITSNSVAANMMNALFEARWDDAKALALPEARDEVDASVEAFAAFYDEYELREYGVGELSRPGGFGEGNQEVDREFDVNFQYKLKEGTDNWHSGVLQLRVKVGSDGLWGIGIVRSAFPRW